MPSILAPLIPASARPFHRWGHPRTKPRWQRCQEHSLSLAVPKEAGREEQEGAGGGAGKVLGAGVPLT